jgi:hypothetical protein
MVKDVEGIQVCHSCRNIPSKPQEFPFIFAKSIQNGEEGKGRKREKRGYMVSCNALNRVPPAMY